MSRLTIEYSERLGGSFLDWTLENLTSIHVFCQRGSFKGEIHIPGLEPIAIRSYEAERVARQILRPMTAGMVRLGRAA